jgi:hypothetical protein
MGKRKVVSIRRCAMKISFTKNIGMLCLGAWLILTGLAGFGLALPAPILALLAIIAGVLILIGR